MSDTSSAPGPTIARRYAVSAGRRAAAALAGRGGGSVLAVFARSAYVEIEGSLLVLADARLLNGPLNVLLAPADPAARVDPNGPPPPSSGRHQRRPADAAVPVDPDRGDGLFEGLAPDAPAAVSDGTLTLGDGWAVEVRRARVWDARLVPITGTEAGGDLAGALDVITAALDAGAPPESLARPDARPPRASRGMADLAEALRTDDPARAGALAYQAAAALAGLGPGLTPSGDDLLAGAMIALALLAPARAPGVAARILAGARDRTTRISRAYLDAAAAGEAGEAWHALASLLAGPAGTDRARDLAGAVGRILSFGETSGSDMLAGFVLAMRECLRRASPSAG